MAVAVALLVGCSTPSAEQGPTESPWKAAIEAEREFLSDYEWEILKDYEVTDAELRDAKDKAAECLSAKGIEYEPFWPYGSRIGQPRHMDNNDFNREYDECTLGTVVRVESYHLKLRENPNNEDWYSLILACLKDRGLVERSLTEDDIKNSRSPNYPPSTVTETAEWARCEQNPLDVPELREYVDSIIPEYKK